MNDLMRRPAVAVGNPNCVSAVLLVVYGNGLSAQHRQSNSLSAEGEVAAGPRTGAAAYQGRGLISTSPAPCPAIDEGVGKAPCVDRTVSKPLRNLTFSRQIQGSR